MKKIIFSAALLLPCITATANDFEGAYIGANLGENFSTATSMPDKSQVYFGGKAGYNWTKNDFLLGAEGGVDWHPDAYTLRDAGVDARIGYLMDHWMPYVRLGVMGTYPGARLHSGLGVEYSLSVRWAINADWTSDSITDGATTFKNNNLVVGLNLRFGADSPQASPALEATEGKALADRAAADRAAADRAAADRAAADRAAADRAAADRAAADRAAADRAAAETEAAERAAHPVYYHLVAGKTVALERTFPFAKAEFYSSADKDLDEVARYASDHKETHIVVTGYTDDVGSEKVNFELSVERAKAVKTYLVKQGVAAERIATKGAGASRPLADDKSEDSRARNRRVEIIAVIQESKKISSR